MGSCSKTLKVFYLNNHPSRVMEIFAVHRVWYYDEKEKRERQKERIQKDHKHHPVKSQFCILGEGNR